jgi:hypothetical protein
MPLTPVGLTAVLLPTLISSGMVGPSIPQYALGVSNGVTAFLQSATVQTTDVGTLGSGVGLIPLIVPQPLLLTNILQGMQAAGTFGPMAPMMALGLANGLAAGLLQGLITTTHPGIGVGAGVARIVGAGSAIPQMIQGFSSAGMNGPGSSKQATALGIALDSTFATFLIPTPIAGPPSPSGGSGVGFGKIV